MCSSSIPLEPEEVAVAVTAAGATPENLDAGPEHHHPQDAEKRRLPPYMGMRDCMVVLRLTPCDHHRPDCLGLSSRGWRQAAKIGQQGEAGVSFSARVPVNNAGGIRELGPPRFFRRTRVAGTIGRRSPIGTHSHVADRIRTTGGCGFD